jgi:hypothetical protein
MMNQLTDVDFEPPLDDGIRDAVLKLREGGIETFESCEGGSGHAYPEPTIRFHGDTVEGLRAVAAAMRADLHLSELRRVWVVVAGELTGPYWELVLRK